LGLSKKRKERLTGLLSALHFYSIRQLFTENKQEFPGSLVFSVPVNFRIRYSPSLDFSQMRPHVCAPECCVKLESGQAFVDEIWTNTASINRDIEHKSDMKQTYCFQFGFDEESSTEELYFMKEATKGDQEAVQAWLAEKVTDFGVSNIGKWVWDQKRPDLSRQQPLRLTETYFCDAQKSEHVLINSCIVYFSYWNDELQCTLTMNARALGKAYGRRLVDLFVANLTRFVNEN
jgi:hypothetical protein